MSNNLAILIFLAWRNIWRNHSRSVLTMTALSGGLVLMIFYASLLDGMLRQMTNLATQVSMGQVQIHRPAYEQDQDLYATIPWSILQDLEQQNPDWSFAPRLYAAGLASTRQLSNGVILKAVDPQRENQVTSLLTHLRAGQMDLGRSEDGYHRVIIGGQLAKNLQAGINGEIILITQASDGSIGNGIYIVAGILKPVDPMLDQSGIVMSVKAFQELMALENGAHEIAATSTQYQPMLIKTQLLQQLDSNNFTIKTWQELVPVAADMINTSQSVVYVMGAVLILLASFGMFNAILMSVSERMYEFGILMSIGMKRRWLIFMVMNEALFLALISAVIGMILGGVVAYWMQTSGLDLSAYMPEGLDMAGLIFEPIWYGTFSMSMLFLSAVLMIIIAMASALVPALRLLRLQAVEAMRS